MASYVLLYLCKLYVMGTHHQNMVYHSNHFYTNKCHLLDYMNWFRQGYSHNSLDMHHRKTMEGNFLYT